MAKCRLTVQLIIQVVFSVYVNFSQNIHDVSLLATCTNSVISSMGTME